MLDLGEHEEHEDFNIITFAKTQINQYKKLKTLPTPAIIQSTMLLVAVIDYIQLRTLFKKNPKSSKPWMSASLRASKRMAKGPAFARKIRYTANFLQIHHRLPPYNPGKGARHTCWLDNEDVLLKIKLWLAEKQIGEIKPQDLQKYFIQNILPIISPEMTKELIPTICKRTIIRWLHRLGYDSLSHKKGVYVDGHERPDVKCKRAQYLEKVSMLEG